MLTHSKLFEVGLAKLFEVGLTKLFEVGLKTSLKIYELGLAPALKVPELGLAEKVPRLGLTRIRRKYRWKYGLARCAPTTNRHEKQWHSPLLFLVLQNFLGAGI